MKNIYLIAIALCLTYTHLSAEDFYIKVMSARYKDTLYDATKKFHLMGYNMHLFEYEEWYRIYTGPFKDRNEAKKALRFIRENGAEDAYVVSNYIDEESSYPVILQDAYIVRNFNHKEKEPDLLPIEESEKVETPLAIKTTSTENKLVGVVEAVSILTEDHVVEEVVVDKKLNIVEETVVKDEKTTTVQDSTYSSNKKLSNEKRYIVGMALGAVKFDIDEKDISGNIATSKPDDTGITYELEVGYKFTKRIFMTLDYQKNSLDDTSFDNVFGTVNYKFENDFFASPYIGIMAGYSIMTWDKYPISSSSNNEKSDSFMSGVQIGVEMPILDNFALYSVFRYMMMSHKTNIKKISGEKEFEHTSSQNLNIGLRYEF